VGNDFQLDQAVDGRAIKLLKSSTSSPAKPWRMHVATSITADDTVRVLDRLARERGACALRQGPRADRARAPAWCRFQRAKTAFIEPGAPWQNPFVESFNGRVRDELLNIEQFSGLAEARVVIADLRHDYNHHRPHSALGMQGLRRSRRPGPRTAGVELDGRPARSTPWPYHRRAAGAGPAGAPRDEAGVPA